MLTYNHKVEINKPKAGKKEVKKWKSKIQKIRPRSKQ